MASLRNNLRRFHAARSAWLAGFLVLAACLGYGQAVNSCLDCHSAGEGKLQVTPEKFSQDIHAQQGLTCTSSRGGTSPSYDPAGAMSRRAGGKGKKDQKQIPQLCAPCHSN